MKTSILDILHKAIYPALFLALAIFSLWSNTDKQRQLDRLRATVDAAEEKHHQAEDQAHQLRVQMLRRAQIFVNSSNSVMEEKAGYWIKSNYSDLCTVMQIEDQNRFGEAKAKELWAKAKEQADKEVSERKWYWDVASK